MLASSPDEALDRAGIDKGSLELIREIFADNAVIEDPVGTEPKEGIDAIMEFYSQSFEMKAKLSLNGPSRSAGNSVVFPFQADAAGMKIQIIDVRDLASFTLDTPVELATEIRHLSSAGSGRLVTRPVSLDSGTLGRAVRSRRRVVDIRRRATFVVWRVWRKRMVVGGRI